MCHFYNTYPDGSLRTLSFLIIVLATVMSSESVAKQNTYDTILCEIFTLDFYMVQ